MDKVDISIAVSSKGRENKVTLNSFSIFANLAVWIKILIILWF